MDKNKPNRIHIIGSVGSGKTTLARSLSTKLNVPYYELDNVVWMRGQNGDIKRNPEDRDEYLNQIIRAEAWIVEGVHHMEWVFPSWQNADLIIFLDTGYTKRKYRIIKRFVRQITGLEKANYKPTFGIFKKMFEWNATFEYESKPEILRDLKQYKDKLVVLKDNNEIQRFLDDTGATFGVSSTTL